VRYLLLAVWILVSAGSASADWDEVMSVLERATRGPAYDIGVDPSEPGWVATRKARFDDERGRMRSADPGSESRRDPIPCRASSPADPSLHCD